MKKQSVLLFIMAVSCGSLAANIYYAQPIVQFIAENLHMSAKLSGLLTTFTQIGYALGLFLIVPMADLIKSKRLIIFLIGSMLLAILATLFTTSGWSFLIATMVIGIGSCAAQIIVPLTMKIAPIKEIGNYVGKVMSGLLIGIMLARPLSIAITDWFGWRMVFLFSFILLVIVLFLLMKFLPNYEIESISKISYVDLIKSMWTLLVKTPALQQRAFYHACLFATFSLYWTVLPILLREEFLGFSNNEISLIGFVAIVGALLAPTIGRLADKGHMFLMTNLSMLLVFLSIILLFFVRDHSAVSIVLLILSGTSIDIGIAGNLLLGQKVIFSLNPEMRNRLNGLYMALFFLGGAFGSWVGGYVYYTFSPEGALLIGAVVPVIAWLVHLLKNKKSIVLIKIFR